MIRTTIRRVTFVAPFTLDGVEGTHPPGSYDVEIDEEPVAELSFPVYRRIETRMVLPWITIGRPGTQTVTISAAALDAALARDAAA